MWVRRTLLSSTRPAKVFQFTHPCGCDVLHSPLLFDACGFNSRTRVGATHHPRRGNGNNHGFNSRTRVGATERKTSKRASRPVSIHAPVWVRRSETPRSSRYFRVSIHAPVWVRPPSVSSRASILLCFNSRTRVGATVIYHSFLEIARVSIHAPVWVRPHLRLLLSPQKRFQFTHPCGCDRMPQIFRRSPVVSIHAPVWVRPFDACNLALFFSFNSRTRVGATIAREKNLF